jgi:hypothetical protein
MNPSTPFPGGGFQLTGPIWHPPVSSQWILGALIVFGGATANRIPNTIRTMISGPVGFFLLALVALIAFKANMAILTFALLFFLLMVWSVDLSRKTEGFLNASNTVDWVQNSRRWFVESVLKERPLGIQEKDVRTYPVQD